VHSGDNPPLHNGDVDSAVKIVWGMALGSCLVGQRFDNPPLHNGDVDNGLQPSCGSSADGVGSNDLSRPNRTKLERSVLATCTAQDASRPGQTQVVPLDPSRNDTRSAMVGDVVLGVSCCEWFVRRPRRRHTIGQRNRVGRSHRSWTALIDALVGAGVMPAGVAGDAGAKLSVMLSSPVAPRLACVELRNIRGFRHLKLDFQLRQGADPSVPSTAVVIGKNGTNKSTLLRAIALGLASSEDASTMLSIPLGSFVRHGAKDASVKLTVRDASGATSHTITKRLTVDPSGRDRLVGSDGPSAEDLELLVCAYGAGRGVTGTDSGRTYRLWDGVATLFDYRTPLLSPELTLRRLQDWLGDRTYYERTIASIANMLGFNDPETSITLSKGGGIQFSGRDVGRDIPLDGLADGYRVAFNWIIDLYGRALSRDWVASDGSVAALVLVDEIDQHLHPELQARVITELERVFPYSTFIVTTHSPLVALGSHPSQLVALQRDGETVTALERVPDFRAFTPEDVLLDDRLFDTNALNPQFRALLDRRDGLARIAPAQRTPEDTEELRAAAQAITDVAEPGFEQFASATARVEAILFQRK
jgi:hypothetical protein